MRTINKMVIQPNTPNDNKVLWLNKNNASYYNNGTWVTIGKSSEDIRELEEKVDSLDVDMQTVEKEIQNINSRHNDLSSKHESLNSMVSEHTKQIESNQSQITANKSAQDAKNASLDDNIKKLNTRDDQITELVKGITATGGASVATAVTYDNTSSQLASATVQGAVDELQTAIADETKRAKAAEEAIIFDVSVQNNGAVFESLSALLSSSNLSTLIPTSVRHGGMIIRFIQGSEQSSWNKYVQYRLMATSFSTTESDWQGVDEEPIAVSDNLIKSGGVYKHIKSRKEITQFTRFGIQKESQKLSFSDNTFGNLTTQFTVSVIFNITEIIYNNTDVVIVGKGDYTTNGWAVVRKPSDKNVYLVVNNISYTLIDAVNAINAELNYNITLISTEQCIDVYIFNKKVLSLSKDNLTNNNSPFQIGGKNTNIHSKVYCLFAALWYKDISIEECINDVSKVYKGKFSRNDLAADFVCCVTSLVDNGFVDGEYSLLCENAMPITYVDIQASKGININNSFDTFGIVSGRNYYEGFIYNNNIFTTSLLDVSNYCKANIYKLGWYQLGNDLVCIFYNERKCVISSIKSTALTKDGDGYFYSYKNQWSVDIPVDAKYMRVCLCIDGYVTFDKRDDEYITPSIIDVPKYTDKSFNKVPCIIFESNDYLSAYYIQRKGYWEDKDGIEVLTSNSENKTISISTDYLSYFDNNILYNMVYETPNGEQDFMYLFRNTDDGIMHILSDVVPPIGTMLYTYVQVREEGKGGDMHMSTLAYRVLGHKIVEDSHNIYNAQLTNRCGCYFFNPIMAVKGALKDVNGNDCFYFNGQTFGLWSGLQGSKTWGVRENSTWFRLNNNRNAYFKHKAPFKKGYYDIKAVASRFYENNSGSQVENYPVTINVYNDEHLIHTQTVCDYRFKRIIVGIDRECSGNQILNLNKEVEDKAYTNTNMIISAIPQDKKKLGMIVTARISNNNGVFNSKWTTLMFIGDTLEKFTEADAWIEYTFGCVKIEFVNENSNDALVAINRIMQYDFYENYFDMGINAPTLIQNDVGKNPSYVAVLGDSWTEAADASIMFEEGIKYYNYFSIPDKGNPTILHGSRPLLRGIMEKGCNVDTWGMGTKTAMWGLIHQIRPLVQHTEYTHCVVEFFSNDNTTDWYSAMVAIVKILQENGIIPIVFAPISGREKQTGYLKAVL